MLNFLLKNLRVPFMGLKMGSQVDYDQLSHLKQIYYIIKDLVSYLKKETVTGTPVEQQLSCTRPEFIWSVENDGDYSLIRFNYHEEFNKFIKTLKNFIWWEKKNGCWKYNRNENQPDFIVDEIKYKFPEWNFIDKR